MKGASPEISSAPKRKRGRPRKNPLINDASFKNMTDKNNNTSEVYFTMEKDKTANVAKTRLTDELFHALLAKIYSDPVSYDDAMNSKDKEKWQDAINNELNAMIRNDVWIIVDRQKTKYS